MKSPSALPPLDEEHVGEPLSGKKIDELVNSLPKSSIRPENMPEEFEGVPPRVLQVAIFTRDAHLQRVFQRIVEDREKP